MLRTMSTAYLAPTDNTTLGTLATLKPGACAVTVYVPIVRATNSYLPAELVLAVFAMPVASFFTVISAPATTACEASVTIPRMLPLAPACPKRAFSDAEKRHKQMTEPSPHLRVRCFMVAFHLF